MGLNYKKRKIIHILTLHKYHEELDRCMEAISFNGLLSPQLLIFFFFLGGGG